MKQSVPKNTIYHYSGEVRSQTILLSEGVHVVQAFLSGKHPDRSVWATYMPLINYKHNNCFTFLCQAHTYRLGERKYTIKSSV